MTEAVKPDVLGGFRDALPSDMIVQQDVISRIRKVYESFGFFPLDTPCMERWDVLTGGSKDFNKSIFVAKIATGKEDRGTAQDWEENYALRFDLTVSLARVIAAYPDLPKPFKRYQIGKVWRGEKPQKGRFREFVQFDFDIIGSRSILADTEVVQIMYEVMRELGIQNFLIRFNTRKILNGLAELAGAKERANDVFRVLDKLDKIGIDGVVGELQRQPENQYDDSALALPPESTEKVVNFLNISDDDPSALLSKLQSFFGSASATGIEGVEELRQMVKNLTALNISQKNWKVDLSVARGLDYYTGPVFETMLTDAPELGSVLSGGRFDGLTNRFVPNSNIPGVGASVGVDRLIVGMQDLGLLSQKPSLTQALVTVFSPELEAQSLAFAQELRRAGVRAEVYLGGDSSLRAQLTYAAKLGIPAVIIMGPDEAARGVVQYKDMTNRKQTVLTKTECLASLKRVFP